MRNPQMFGNPRKPTRGILLFGPPGTGKTVLAKACAAELDRPFLYISSNNLYSRWFPELT
jgi:vacuolar protein-sorting-associated protein 4